MKKILIIDDEQTSIELLRKRLEANSYEVIAAMDGMEGLVLAQQNVPDLILLDIMMPNLDGKSFITQIKNDQQLKSIPIIVISGHENIEGIINQDMISGCIVKPVNVDSLLEKIKQILA